jgi:hypothetical protein
MTNSNSRLGVHRETLSFLKLEGMLDGTTLAMGVERKVRQGQELNDVEAGILNHCITTRQLRFIRQHGL